MSTEDTDNAVSQRVSRPTLKAVADACGLAVTTVSRALNDADDIALRTRQRVREAADQLGYVPNRAGQRFAEIGAQRLVERGRKRLMLINAPPGFIYATYMRVGFERAATRTNAAVVDMDERGDLLLQHQCHLCVAKRRYPGFQFMDLRQGYVQA